MNEDKEATKLLELVTLMTFKQLIVHHFTANRWHLRMITLIPYKEPIACVFNDDKRPLKIGLDARTNRLWLLARTCHS